MNCEYGKHECTEARILNIPGSGFNTICENHFREFVGEDAGQLFLSWERLVLSEPTMNTEQALFWSMALRRLAEETDNPQVMVVLTQESMSLILCDFLTAPITLGEPI